MSRFLSKALLAVVVLAAGSWSKMTQQGLKFAPALPGSEPAYFGLYSAMVAYAMGGESESGFRVRLAPPIVEQASGAVGRAALGSLRRRDAG